MKHSRILYLVFLFLLAQVALAQKIDYDLETMIKKLPRPATVEAFNPLYHLPPVNQDTTNACWSFATISFLESEMHRIGLPPVKLSVMFPFFHAYVEKAREFIATEGKSRFAAGDLFTGVTEIIKQYGIVPEQAYTGLLDGRTTHNHKQLEAELKDLMNDVKKLELWDEEFVLQKVRKILYKHLGVPPQSFEYEGRMYTPKSFLAERVILPWDDYILITSFMHAPFDTFVKLDVPDNWAQYETYFNVPLDVFFNGLKNALRKGYSAAFDSDTGEPGRMGAHDIAFIPEFDLPAKYIDQKAREFRFQNGSTTDDHLMHMVGYTRHKGQDWFLVKDSWRTAWLGEHPGYYFFHGDYIRLKALAYLVHKDAVPEITKRIKKP